MKKQILITSLGLLFSAASWATEHHIQVEIQFFPAPASTHLDFTQKALAKKAIETCGSEGAVGNISKINIQINKMSEDYESVASLSPTQDLFFIYPKILAEAQLSCLGEI